MSFSIKQLLLCMAVMAIGLMALANAGKPFVKELIDLLTLCTLIWMAYFAWISDGPRRAFRLGFVSWGVLYYWLFKHAFDIGTTRLLVLLSAAFRNLDQRVSNPNNPASGISAPDLFGPPQIASPTAEWEESYYSIGNALFLLLFALIGGWITLYFYRKRQRMFGGHEVHRSG